MSGQRDANGIIAAGCHAAARAAGAPVPAALMLGLPACFTRPPAGATAALPSGLDLARPSRSLGDLHQRLLDVPDRGPTRRKTTGAYYTPAALVDRVLDAALTPLLAGGAPPSVCDPACGSGLFLVGAAERLARASSGSRADAALCVHGADISPAAVAVARLSLWLWCGGAADPAAIARRVRVADALLDSTLAQERFDAVVGNPPFLNQLGSATAVSRSRAAAHAARSGAGARGYAAASADSHALATRLTRPGGYVAMVQPQSLLAARDAGPARASALSRAALVGLWAEPADGPRHFAAGVRVCIPVLRVRPDAAPDPSPSRAPWAPRLAAARGLPDPAFAAGGTLADVATATADFRDQYYGLRDALHERLRPTPSCPMLVTTGLIDPAACLWGTRPARLLGGPRANPCADLSRLDPAMRRWAAQRLVPKVLLATQTRVLEAWADERGEALPVVPLITILPRRPADLWRLAAAVSSPVAAAWAATHYAGAGLSADAIKLSARQTLQIPVPRPGAAWDRAAELFRSACASPSAPERAADLTRAAEAMVEAFQVPPPDAAHLMRWWAQRARPRRRAAAPA
jgi:hypothetical protein